ncbi:MAG: TonB-dependent receptor [Acidobacteria bacterium]|nr:TonB-dependent receptor [Acidobacteriota bacterium]
MKLVRLVIAFAVTMTIDAPLLLAQVDQGRIAGTVRDQSNAFAAATPVTVKNERTGEARAAVTNEKGYFLVSGLKPSTYTIRVERAGFSTVEYTAMPLAVGQELTLDFELKPAGVQEAVTVIGAAPVIDLSSAKIGVHLGEREVNNLPVNGRQMSQLMLQAPGSQNAGTGTWQDIRFSGRAVEQNAIRYDGVEGSAIIDAAPGNLNGEVATPFKLQASLENIQEFRVESSAYPAEFGTGSGGQVSVITKSGSNAFHGAGFEYLRNDALDAPNYFDTAAGLPKSLLKQNQFGGSIGGPIAKNRAFFFGSYEGYRLNAGINIVEAVPSDAAWARAVPAIAPLRGGFLAPGAVILPGKSSNADFDIAQLQTTQDVREDAFSTRLDVRFNDRWSSYVRVFRDHGTSDQPNSVAGQVIHTTANPSNAVFNLQGILSDRTTNEMKIGYNAAPTTLVGVAPTVNGIDFSNFILNLSGSVANTGVAGQGASSGVTVPGGLIRANSAQNGRAQPYDPYTVSLIDASFTNVNAFLANQPSTIQYLGDESAPSVFNGGATGPRHLEQEYYIAYAQDEWHVNPKFTLNYGVRYDYYTPMREANNLQVKFNVDTGQIDPNTTPLFISTKTNIQPRLGATYAASEKTVVRGGFGMFVGPGQTEDQIQPVADSDRISTTLSTGALAFPLDASLAVANFVNNPNNRSYQPRAFANDYRVPERIWQYTASIQQDFGARMVATAAYVGSQGRNLFLRSVANQITQVITNPNPANAAFVIREFSIVQRDVAGNVTGVQNPYLRQHQRFERSAHRGQQCAHDRSVRLRPRLQRLRRAEHVQRERAVCDSVRSRPPSRGERRCRRDPRRLGRRRHHQRAQWPADRRAHHAAGRRVYGRHRRRVQQSRRRPHGDDQYAWRRQLAQRAPSRSRGRRQPVRPGRRAVVPESGRLRDAAAGQLREPRTRCVARTRLPAGGSRRREALSDRWHEQPRVPHRGVQPVQRRELLEPGRDAAECAADQRGHRSEQGAAWPAVHRERRRDVRRDYQYGRPDRRFGNQPPDPVRAAVEFLNSSTLKGWTYTCRGTLSGCPRRPP